MNTSLSSLHKISNNWTKTISSYKRWCSYEKQDRGNLGAYVNYREQMDAVKLQKVAIAASFTVGKGTVADMGAGSGSNSFDLALLYPKMKVVAVDINPTMIKIASESYNLANLTFQVGDISERCFPENSQDVMINSSVLHHVTSFGNPPYCYESAKKAIENQAAQLRDYGVLIVRDFLDPGSEPVILELPEEPEAGDKSETCSAHTLFRKFTNEFRVLSDKPGCPYKELPAPHGVRWYELSKKLATEFILRKDYREAWDLEIQEEYTYFTQKEFEQVFDGLKLRRLASKPILNPWILANRYQGKCLLRDLNYQPLDYPATNYLIVGEKVPANEGVEIKEARSVAPIHYLEHVHYKRKTDGYVYDLVRRPLLTLDIIPYYFEGDKINVMSRRSYPRPILTSNSRGTEYIDGSAPVGYITEPINTQVKDKPVVQTAEELLLKYGISEISKLDIGVHYFPSPGGVQEEIKSLFVKIAPPDKEGPSPTLSGFSTSGALRSLEANHILQAAQVGAMPDARLENNIYKLLLDLGVDIDAWIGEKIELQEGSQIDKITTIEELIQTKPRRLFQKTEESSDFLELCSSEFEEFDAQQKLLAKQTLEFVIPKNFSNNTIAAALLRRYNNEIYIGIFDDDLPAIQSFKGHSNLLTPPAWRIPKDIVGTNKSRAWVLKRLEQEYNVTGGHVWELGGNYYPSSGVTPEVVFPLAIEAKEGSGVNGLLWVSLKEAIKNHERFDCGHLRIVMFRAAHALGLLKSETVLRIGNRE